MNEEDKKKKADKEEEEGPAEGILKGIGGIIPGLGGLLKGLEKSPAFKERLKKIDEEVERKFKETPLKRTEERKFKIRGKFEARHLAPDKPPHQYIGGGGKPSTMRREAPPPMPQERPVDIFDEKDHLKIIAEIPGVDENDIKVNLQGAKLTISVDIPGRKYHQEAKLPCTPEGDLKKSYKNGVLEIKIIK